MGAGTRMRDFWDRRAREDAFYFVDNRLAYRRPNRERFWREGEVAVDTLLGSLGVELRGTERVLEIGCGVGRLTRAIAGRAREVEALDVSPEMLELARQHNPDLSNVRWLLGDGTSLAGIASASADACLSHVVFQHVPDPAITLGYVRETGRVLRAGGWAAFQVSNDPRVHERPPLPARFARRTLAALRRAPGGQDAAPWRGSAVSLEALELAANRGGLSLERVTGVGSQFCLVLLRRQGERNEQD